MLAGISSRQFAEWVAYGQMDPFGEERADYRMAHALAILLSFFSGGKWKGSVADLMPTIGWRGDDEVPGAPAPGSSDGLATAASKHPNEYLFEQLVREAAPEWQP